MATALLLLFGSIQNARGEMEITTKATNAIVGIEDCPIAVSKGSMFCWISFSHLLSRPGKSREPVRKQPSLFSAEQRCVRI